MRVDPEERTEKSFELCDEFSYTLKRFGLINRTVRYWWACQLHVLLTQGSEASAAWAKEFYDDANNWL
jgi:hypothetical protein